MKITCTDLRVRQSGHLKCISPPPNGAIPLFLIVSSISVSTINLFNNGIHAALILSTDGSVQDI